jgi:hypothetical protein
MGIVDRGYSLEATLCAWSGVTAPKHDVSLEKEPPLGVLFTAMMDAAVVLDSHRRGEILRAKAGGGTPFDIVASG